MDYNNTENETLSTAKDEETFQVEDLSSNHKWRTETPNIILDIGLNCYEGWLYVHIKRIAADGGQCTCSNNTLMDKTKIGLTKLKECKKSLQDKGLIKITERKNPDKSNKPSLIQIADMWEKNFIHFQKIKEEKKRTGVVVQRPPCSRTATATQSYSDHEEELYEEEQYIKKEEASNDASLIFKYFDDSYKKMRKAKNLSYTPIARTKSNINAIKVLLKSNAKEHIINVINKALNDEFWFQHVNTPHYLKTKFTSLETLLVGKSKGKVNEVKPKLSLKEQNELYDKMQSKKRVNT